MFLNDGFGTIPGVGSEIDTFVNAFTWGKGTRIEWFPATINSLAVDSGNSPTWELRQGLVLGQITTTQQWKAYSPTATDGSDVAKGVLMTGLRMQDLQGSTRPAFYGIMVAGGLIAGNLIGLDYQARQQMRGAFQFDDDIGGQSYFPWKGQLAKTADFTLTAALSGYLFDNTGAVGTVNLTLPAISNGKVYGALVVADFTLTVTSAEGDNIIGPNDISMDSFSWATAGDKMGGLARVYSNPGATKWIVEKLSSNALTWVS